MLVPVVKQSPENSFCRKTCWYLLRLNDPTVLSVARYASNCWDWITREFFQSQDMLVTAETCWYLL